MSRRDIHSVFYAELYHPIQAGSIDGTDILPHDNAVYRALLCSSAGLCMYFSLFHPHTLLFLFQFCLDILTCFIADDPLGDPKLIGDPYCTVFVGRLSHLTTEDTVYKVRLCICLNWICHLKHLQKSMILFTNDNYIILGEYVTVLI